MKTLPTLMLLPVLLAGGCATGNGLPSPNRLEPYQCGNMQRLHVYRDVFLGSQPSPEDLEHAQKGGIRTVVNLRHASELEFDEASAVRALGMHYITLPWNGPNELTDAILDRGREILRTAEKPLLMHCSSANRVGAIWLTHRAVDHGIPLDTAEQEARVVGLKTPAYATKARDHARRHGAR